MEMPILEQFIRIVVALFIITNPIGNLPFFIGLTEGESIDEHRKTFLMALLTGLFMLAFFGFAGSIILSIFNLDLDDLRIAGGILLFVIAIEILMRSKVEVGRKEDVGVVPLGCPLLVGPGAITTLLVMLKMYNIFAVFSGVVICFALIWLVLYFAQNIYGFLGKNGTLIVTKISAIIIATIAVSFVRQGIHVIFQL